jgi:hypothetical protein
MFVLVVGHRSTGHLSLIKTECIWSHQLSLSYCEDVQWSLGIASPSRPE